MLDSIFIPSHSPSFDGLRKMNRARRLGFIGTPEFERIFDDLFKDIDIEKILRKHLQPVDRPKVSIKIDDDGETDQELKDNFKWKVGEDNDVEGGNEDEEEEPYIHEPDVMYVEDEDEDAGLDEGDAYEDDASEKVPPSIFDMLSSGKGFSDLVSPNQPKHTEIYRQAFGLDDNGDPIPLPEDEEDDENEPKPLKNDPSVFIANRLTFLIQTIQPVIFDTSSIEVKDNAMTVAINEEKTFPKITTIDQLGFITCRINNSPTILRAIDEFLGDDCFYSNIYCFPTKTVDRHGKDVFAIRFVCYRK